jgi:hypothetical protein
MKTRIRFFTAMTAILIAGCTHYGQRFLRMEIHQNDQLVLRTTFHASDREGPEDFWRRAGMEPFDSDGEVAQVNADEGSPLRATLAGPVRITIWHVDRQMTSASLINVVLLRSAPETQNWYLAPEEVQRAVRAAGL